MRAFFYKSVKLIAVLIAKTITGKAVQVPADPKAEIIEILDRDYGLIEKA